MKRKSMWKHRNTHKQRKQPSDIEIQDLNGNWTQDEPKVSKKREIKWQKSENYENKMHE